MSAGNAKYTVGIAVSKIRERVVVVDAMTGVISLHNGAQGDEGYIWYEPTPLKTGSILDARSVHPIAKDFADWRSMEHLLPVNIADAVLDFLVPGLTITLLELPQEAQEDE